VVHICTVAMWSGKDSKDNVVRNLNDIVAEAAELEKSRVTFSSCADCFDKVVESVQYKEWLAEREAAYKSLPITVRPVSGEWLKASDTPETARSVPTPAVGHLFLGCS
jgi:hypothetical protein